MPTSPNILDRKLSSFSILTVYTANYISTTFIISGSEVEIEFDIRCWIKYHHVIMSRTTIDIDDPVLKEIKYINKAEGRSMGKVVSQLLAEALSARKKTKDSVHLSWIHRPMKPLVDLSDKDEIYRILDRGEK